jgi:hypothetical protein
MTEEQFKQTHSEYTAYLLMKVRLKDWHGVSDAANDLRELEAFYKGHTS